MENDNLVRGKIYTTTYDEKLRLQYKGMTLDNTLIFKPMNKHTFQHYVPYSRSYEHLDPLYKEGYIGFSNSSYNCRFIEWKAKKKSS